MKPATSTLQLTHSLPSSPTSQTRRPRARLERSDHRLRPTARFAIATSRRRGAALGRRKVVPIFANLRASVLEQARGGGMRTDVHGAQQTLPRALVVGGHQHLDQGTVRGDVRDDVGGCADGQCPAARESGHHIWQRRKRATHLRTFATPSATPDPVAVLRTSQGRIPSPPRPSRDRLALAGRLARPLAGRPARPPAGHHPRAVLHRRKWR